VAEIVSATVSGTVKPFLLLAALRATGGVRAITVPVPVRARVNCPGVTEILARSRKVRTQIPNKTNFVTARDDGAKGRHHRKAGPGPDSGSWF
jgi:hypothetical protein